MKKILLSALMLTSATLMMAQSHGAMTFAGKSSFYITMMGTTTGNTEVESDTVLFAMNNSTSGSITIPSMAYSSEMVIPSFTIDNAAFTFDYANMTTTFDDQTFSATVTVDGQEKQITGTSLTGKYNHSENMLDITVSFTYGSMPFPLTYHIAGYYVKAYTDDLDVVVGNMFNYYPSKQVTYNVRTYTEDGTTKLDVEVPTYQLENTVMGTLTIGTYTVKGLTYDEEKGGYYRDYMNDGLSLYFSNGGTMNADYSFSAGTMLVTVENGKVTNITNTFKPGAMPFDIVSTFPGSFASSISDVKSSQTEADGKAYNLAGQQVPANTRGIVIINGKKYLNK